MTEAKMTVRGKEIRYVAEDDTRIPVDAADEIPHFETEEVERAFWETHALSERFWREAPRTPEDRLPPVRKDKKGQPSRRSAR